MKNRLSIIFIALVLVTGFFVNTHAQQRPQGATGNFDRNIGILEGILIDSYSKQPVEYGNVILFRQQDSTMHTGTITDPKGGFFLDKIPIGRYYAVIQFIGFEPLIIQDIMFNPRAPQVDLGIIEISPTATSLQGVEIVAERDMMLANLDKRVINVDKDLTGIGGTAVDIMQNIPSVTVDIEGNVKLRGSSNVLILIDGKPSGLQDMSSSDILNQIPAHTIERIEVITNPSVRYDPEGTSGIINIVLKKRSLEGLNGMVQGNYGLPDRFNGGINLNLRSEKFNIFGSYDNRYNPFRGSTTLERATLSGSNITYLNQEGDFDNKMNMHLGSLGFDFMPDRYNTYSTSLRYRYFDRRNDGSSNNITSTEMGDILRQFNRSASAQRLHNSFTYNLSYRRTSKLVGEELTADIIINQNSMEMNEEIMQENFAPDYYVTQQQARSENSNNQGTLKVDYTRPLNESSRIEGGLSGNIKGMNMRYNYDWWDSENSEWVEDPLLANYFRLDEQIYGIYGIYAGMTGRVRYQFGLRGEGAVTNGKQELSNDTFRNDYITAYPSVHVVFKISEKQDVQLSYSRRVSRPRHWYLNPYIDYSDSLNIRSGNPELTPEFTGSYDLSYVLSQNRNSLTSSIFFRRTTDMIQPVSRLYTDGIVWTTWDNITEGQFYGVELIGVYNVAKWLRMNANASYFRQVINAFESEDGFYRIERQQDYTWNARLNAQFTVLKNSTLQLSGNYSAPTITAQGRMNEMYFADIAWRTDFFDRKATFSIRLSDVFDTRKFSSETMGAGFKTVSERKMESRVLWIGLSYRWNNFQRQRDRIRNGDEMDMGEF